MRYIYMLLGLILFVIFMGFSIYNSDPVEVKGFLGFYWRTTLSLVMLVFVMIGVLMGLLAMLNTQIRLRRELIRLRRELRVKNQPEPSKASALDDLIV